MDAKKIAEENRIFETVSGSRAYGTFTPTSDIDHRGLFIAPKEIRNSCFEKIEEYCEKNNDRTLYELKKFMSLIANANPNIIELLFIPENLWVHSTPAFHELHKHRDMFVTKKLRHTFSGYAFSQLKRMNNHHEWMKKSVEKPKLENFLTVISPETGLIRETKSDDELLKSLELYCCCEISSGVFNMFYDLKRENVGIIKEENFAPVSITKKEIDEHRYSFQGTMIFNKVGYKQQMDEYQNYTSWVTNRNKARSEFEQKYGYDTKHAMHLVRLLRMCKGALSTGTIEVVRSDAEELKEIRNGKMTYEEIIEYAEQMDSEIESLYQNCSLPHGCDSSKINDLYQRMIEIYDKG